MQRPESMKESSTIVKGCARISGFYVSTIVDTDTIAPYDGQTVARQSGKTRPQPRADDAKTIVRPLIVIT